MIEEEKYMQLALALAAKGKGKVSPNPLVGCVIVKNGSIIGQGYHQQYGEPHAEVNAVRDAGEENVAGTDVYVSLEPCAHYGKTPPCAELLVRVKPKRVIICNLDPNPLVAGKGIAILEENGIEVKIGVLEKKGLELNKRFFTSITKKRPFVLLKWAQTADGFVARKNYDSKWISCEASRKLVHEWRAEEDAILVGKNTAKHDNPSLNIRFGIEGKNPLRVILDKDLSLPTTLHIYDRSQPTIIFNGLKSEPSKNLSLVQLDYTKPIWEQVLAHLHTLSIRSVLVEGGSKVLQSIIEANLWDEARVFTSSTHFKEGIKAPVLAVEKLVSSSKMGKDRLEVLKNKKG